MTTQPRQWPMWGHLNTERPDVTTWLYVAGDRRMTRLYLSGSKHDPQPVLAIEDPDGEYLGWLDALRRPEQPEVPVMVQHKRIFNVQFPYGYKAEVERGRGEAVPLRIEAR